MTTQTGTQESDSGTAARAAAATRHSVHRATHKVVQEDQLRVKLGVAGGTLELDFPPPERLAFYGGLAAAAGPPEALRVMLGLFIAIGGAIWLLHLLVAMKALVSAAVASLLLAAWLGRRLGGCTGDTLGAVQQTAEVAFLFAIVSQR